MSIHEFVEQDCKFVVCRRKERPYPKRHIGEKPEFDDLFGPTYDEVMRYGKKIREKDYTSCIAQVWEYEGVQYGLLWDKETGRNLSYDKLGNILQRKEEREKS